MDSITLVHFRSGSPESIPVYRYVVTTMKYGSLRLRGGLIGLGLCLLAGCVTDSLPDLCGVFNCEAEDQFETIADSLGGESYTVEDSLTAGEIAYNILDTSIVNGTDVVFLIDRTGSMGDDIGSVKAIVGELVSLLDAHTNVRLAMGFYRDIHADGQDWYKIYSLSSNYTPALTALSEVNAYGGGDNPESLYDALFKTLDELNWSPGSKKLLIVIGDAPSHTGSKTNHSLSEIKTKAAELGAAFTIFTILSSPL
jgi:hypothetical protein